MHDAAKIRKSLMHNDKLMDAKMRKVAIEHCITAR